MADFLWILSLTDKQQWNSSNGLIILMFNYHGSWREHLKIVHIICSLSSTPQYLCETDMKTEIVCYLNVDKSFGAVHLSQEGWHERGLSGAHSSHYCDQMTRLNIQGHAGKHAPSKHGQRCEMNVSAAMLCNIQMCNIEFDTTNTLFQQRLPFSFPSKGTITYADSRV